MTETEGRGNMPIQVKTMRDVWDREKWDREKKETKEAQKYKIFPPEIEKHYLDYLAKKKAFLKTKEEIAKTFADYEKRLGEAGFSKI